MYTKPLLSTLDVTSETALCCIITIGEKQIRTPLCRVPFCQIIDPCAVTVGPVTVSG